jgi:hypothetical protein
MSELVEKVNWYINKIKPKVNVYDVPGYREALERFKTNDLKNWQKQV